MTALTCPTCGARLGGGIEVCPACGNPLLVAEHVSATTWTKPETTKVFDRICPWCGGTAVDAGLRTAVHLRCACGAIAMGAPAWDFDEVIDDAIDHFALDAKRIGNRAHEPRWWLELFGVDFREGGVATAGPNEYHFYWFKRA